MGFLTLLMPLVTQLFDRLIPDPAERARQQAEFVKQLTDMAASQDAAQSAINLEEAKSGNLWVAGWRPLFGWVGGAAFAFQYLIKPMMLAFSGFFPEKVMTALLNAPSFDGDFWTLVLGLLGISGLRTYEKIKGVSK